MTTLTDEKRYTIQHCIEIAAVRFDHDAVLCGETPGHERLQQQFELQARDARALALELEGAEYVRLGPQIPDEQV
jgi:hypothetical protein